MRLTTVYSAPVELVEEYGEIVRRQHVMPEKLEVMKVASDR